MSQPFIFVSTHTVKEGKWEEYRKLLQELVEVVETNEPRLIAFNTYFDEESNKVTGVQVHPDAASMEFHMKVAGEHIRTAYEYLEATESTEIYGQASEGLIEGVRQALPPGTPLKVMPLPVVGFTRTNAAR